VFDNSLLARNVVLSGHKFMPRRTLCRVGVLLY
jgi:hypothetical protein